MSNQERTEQRKHRRFPFREDILLDGTRVCTSMDISEGGLYISAIQSFEVNSIVDLIIPFKGEKLTVKAQVRYCQPGIGMGIMFVGLSDEQKAKIKELIAGLVENPAESKI